MRELAEPGRSHWVLQFLYGRSRGARRLRRVAVALGISHGLVSLLMPIAALFPPVVFGKDFVQEYVLARAVRDHSDAYLPVRTLADRYLPPIAQEGGSFTLPTPHPPPVGLLVFPVGLLDYQTAAITWFVLEIVFLVAAIWLLARNAEPRWSVVSCAVAALILVGWAPVYWELFFGQLMVLLLLLLAGARLALKSQRPLVAGLLVGLAILMKTIPWPFVILFAIRREWRAFFGASGTAVLGYAATAAVLGPGQVIDYFTRVAPEVSRLYEASGVNLSAWVLGRRLFEGTPRGAFGGFDITAPALAVSPLAATLVSAALPLGLFVIACVWSRRYSLDAAFGLMTCVAILVSPIAWAHYLVLLCVPTAYVVEWLIQHRFPVWETRVGLALAALFAVPYEGWETAATLLGGQTPVQGIPTVLPPAPALLTLMPTLALALLACFIALLGARESDPAPVRGSAASRAWRSTTAALGVTQRVTP